MDNELLILCVILFFLWLWREITVRYLRTELAAYKRAAEYEIKRLQQVIRDTPPTITNA